MSALQLTSLEPSRFDAAIALSFLVKIRWIADVIRVLLKPPQVFF